MQVNFQNSPYRKCLRVDLITRYVSNETPVCIKLRHIRDMAETSLVARDGNDNRNSSPWFFFRVCGHPRIPRVSKNMDASCRRKSNNGKRTRKQTWPIRFERGNAICIEILLNFYPGLLHFIQISTTLLASFSTISEAEHLSGACWSSLQYSFSPVFAHLAHLLQDSV